MIELIVTPMNNALAIDPLYVDGYDDLKFGQWYNAKLTQPRLLWYHKKMFALVKACYEFQNQYDNFDVFRKVLIFDSGHFDPYQMPDGRILLITDSIAFKNCDQTKFEKIYNDVWQTAMNKYCYDTVKQQEIEARVNILMSF